MYRDIVYCPKVHFLQLFGKDCRWKYGASENNTITYMSGRFLQYKDFENAFKKWFTHNSDLLVTSFRSGDFNFIYWKL